MNKRQKNKKSKTKELREEVKQLKRRLNDNWYLRSHYTERIPIQTYTLIRYPDDEMFIDENVHEKFVQSQLWRELENKFKIKGKLDDTIFGKRIRYEFTLRLDQFEPKEKENDIQ